MRVLDWIDRAAYGEVLIATDFDGTLTEIAPRPESVELDARTRAVLRSLADARQTHVAILSGRTASDLNGRIADLGPLWVSSDHGAVVVDPERRAKVFDDVSYEARLAELRARAVELARVFRGAEVESKPRGVALHYRAVAEEKHQALVEMFRLSCAAHRARPIAGRRVVEGHFGEGNKGAALEYIVSRLPKETSIVYAGDDATDEPALSYAYNHPRGLALHVVSNERAAPSNVHGWLAGPTEWFEILQAIARLRAKRF